MVERARLTDAIKPDEVRFAGRESQEARHEFGPTQGCFGSAGDGLVDFEKLRAFFDNPRHRAGKSGLEGAVAQQDNALSEVWVVSLKAQ